MDSRRSRNAAIRQEAHEIVEAEVARLREESYEALQQYLKTPYAREVTGPSGASHQLEVQAFYDGGKEDGDLRVTATVWKNIRPWATSDFIIARDGGFVGEDQD